MDTTTTTITFLLDIFEELSPNSSKAFNITISDTNTSPEEPHYFFPLYMTILVTFFFAVVFLCGIVGNFLVIVVVWKNMTMRNSTNIFLVNLSIADLSAILVCVPSALSEFYAKDVWHLGEIMCKFVYFLEYTVVNASVLTILAISFERYYAICCPLKAQYVCTSGRTLKVIVGVWLAAIAMNSPFLKLAFLEDANATSTGEPVKVCRTNLSATWTKGYIISNCIVFFILPFIILIYLYGRIIYCLLAGDEKILDRRKMSEPSARLRKQVVVMLISVIVLFFICLLPFRVLSLWLMYISEEELVKFGFEAYYNVLYFARVMFYINSAINPILYNLFSSKFRKAFKSLLCDRYSHSRENSMITNGTVLNRMSRRKVPLKETPSDITLKFIIEARYHDHSDMK